MAIEMNGTSFDQWANSGSKLSYGAWAAGQNSAPASAPASSPISSPVSSNNNWVSNITPTGTPTNSAPASAPASAPVKDVAPFSNEAPVSQAQLQKIATIAEQNKTNTSVANNNMTTSNASASAPITPKVEAATVVPPVKQTTEQINSAINADIAKQKASGLIGSSSPTPNPLTGQTLKAYDENNNVIYVKPGEYVKGASIEMKTIPLDKLAGDNISSINSAGINDNITLDNEVYKPEEKSVFEDIAVKFTQNRDIEFKALEDRRTKALKDINEIDKTLKDRLASFDEVTARAKQIELDMASDKKKANIEGEWIRQQELLNGLDSLMTTTYQTTPDGTVPVSVLNRQNAGKFAGMNSMLKASQGYTTVAIDNITKYYSEARLANANTANQIWSTISLFENRRIKLTDAEQADFMKQIEVLQKQDEENAKKEELINTFIKDNPTAYSYSNITPDDDYNTIISKIGKTKVQVDAFNEIMSKYQDAGITPNMTVAEMTTKLADSQLYKADIASKQNKNEATATEIQNLRSDYINRGIYLTNEDATAIANGLKVADNIYGDGFGARIQETFLSKVLAKETTPGNRESLVYVMSNLMKNGDVKSAVEYINGQIKATLTGNDLTTYNEATNIVDGFDTTISKINGLTDKQKKKINSWFIALTQPIAEITQTDLPKDVAEILTSLNMTWGTVRNALFGASLTDNEQKQSGFILNNKRGLDDVLRQSNTLKEAYEKKADNVLTKNGAILSDNLGMFSDLYKEGLNEDGTTKPDSAKAWMDNYSKANPSAGIDDIINAYSKAVKEGTLNNTNNTTNNKLGDLSSKYESSGNSSAIGYDTTGGFSYGKYQLTEKSGNAANFVKQYYPDEFKGLKPGTYPFEVKWKEVSQREGFGDKEQNYIKTTHFDPAVTKIEKDMDVKVSEWPVALQNVIWSLSVQHGSTGAANMVKTVADNLLKTNSLSAQNLINAIYDERSKVSIYFKSSTPEVQNSVLNRFKKERADALAMLNSNIS